MKHKNWLKIVLFFASFEILAGEEIEIFSGCVGKDVAGREVKVESLSRSLENCPFAKVYLKENEEKYKATIDGKIAESLKNSLDQDLENLMLQGEFFESLGINLLSYGSSAGIKESCQLDKMTEVDECLGENKKEYERRRKSLYSSFGANDSIDFNKKIKEKFKKMTGRNNENYCPLLGSNEQDLDQFLLYQSSFTKASLLELKLYLEKDLPLADIQAKFPMLDLIFKGNEDTAKKFIGEIRNIDDKIDPNVLARAIKEKITNFYSEKENAQSISTVMKNTCLNFNKKIKKFICSDDLKYETQNGAISKRLFDGFDMSQSDLSRNKRVKLQDKEMAFMAFGKKCEIDERDVSTLTSDKRKSLDELIGEAGEYTNGLREDIPAEVKSRESMSLKQIAFCQSTDEKLKGKCSADAPIAASKLREIYSCPDSKSCDDSIELAANYIEGCERRGARNKMLAQRVRGEESSSGQSKQESDAVESDSLDLDFFDNLLADNKTAPAKSIDLTKKDEKANLLKSKALNSSDKAGNADSGNTLKSKRIANDESNQNSKDSNGSGFQPSNFGERENFAQVSNSFKKPQSAKIATAIASSTIASSDATKKTAINSGNADGANGVDEATAKIHAELKERLASLEGQQKGYKNGFEAGSRDSRVSRLEDVRTPKGTKKNSSPKFNDAVYRNGEDSVSVKDLSGNSSPDHKEEELAKAASSGEVGKGSSRSVANNKSQGIGLNAQGVNKIDTKDGDELSPGLVLNLEELSAIDETKLNQLWKDKNSKFIIGVKGDKLQNEKMILSLDKDKKTMIENFQALSLKTRESVLKSKLFKDFKIIRQRDLNEIIKKAI